MQNESICEKNITDCASSWEPFDRTLARHSLALLRGETTTLQINAGTLCNQSCQHCHLDAGPDSNKVMKQETLAQIIAYAKRNHFAVIDITGGSPELNPHIESMITELAPLTTRLTVRTNLTALNRKNWDNYIALCKEHRAVIIASLPSLIPQQTDAQRGAGTFEQSIISLKKLNAAGYGREGSGLELNLVTNPVGTFLASDQVQTENVFHKILLKKWGVAFDKLYSLGNAPLGRFRNWLQQTFSLDSYMQMLVSRFNPCAVSSLMCRSMLSIDWQGYFYDCDFNLAAGLYLGGRKIHVTEMEGIPAAGSSIMIADHCYACTAGTGFS
jgi:radical SAM/Cys-rich protein